MKINIIFIHGVGEKKEKYSDKLYNNAVTNKQALFPLNYKPKLNKPIG